MRHKIHSVPKQRALEIPRHSENRVTKPLSQIDAHIPEPGRRSESAPERENFMNDQWRMQEFFWGEDTKPGNKSEGCPC